MSAAATQAIQSPSHGLDNGRIRRMITGEAFSVHATDPRAELAGIVGAVHAGQASKHQTRRFRDLCDFLDLYIAAAQRTRAKRYPALQAWLGTGNPTASAALCNVSRRTVRDWVDDFLLQATENLQHLDKYRRACREHDKLQAANQAARRAFMDLLASYCAFHHGGGDGRTVEIDPRQYRGTACPACATRAGLKGDAGWGG